MSACAHAGVAAFAGTTQEGSSFQTTADTASRSRRAFRASFAGKRPARSDQGAGNAGRPPRPQPRVQNKTKHTSIVTTVTPEIARHSPRNGFNGFLRALPGVRILGCHRHRRIKVCQTRSGRLASADLAPATGARTTRLRRPRIAPVVRTRFVRSRGSTRPAITLRAKRCRVHRIPPRVNDDGQRPLCPESLAECANGRLRTNRPLLELSPYAPKVTEPVSERGTAPVSSSTRTVARASSPNRARKGVDDGTE
jgi:hypothetical protein